MDSLPGVVHHAADAWARRHQSNIVLAHYDDLSIDLEEEMRRLATRLGIAVAESTWAEIVPEARFERMRSRFAQADPDPADILKSRARFFRRGTSGAGREILSAAEIARYHARIERLAPPDVVRWLERGSRTPP
jgi:hypothetical protein